MEGQTGEKNFKRHVAYKLRIGDLNLSKPVFENEKLKHLEFGSRQVSRINVVANVVDKFLQEGEKKFGSITLDDASGQIKCKVFGDEVEKLSDLNQGDTVMVIGMLRSWNSEVYITPELIKKKEPLFLLIRKLEAELEQPKVLNKEKVAELKDKIISMIKGAEKDGGITIEKIILELKEPPEIINNEIRKLLEEGNAYEPRPGKLRFLG